MNSSLYDELSETSVTYRLLSQDESDTQSVADSFKRVKKFQQKLSIDLPVNNFSKPMDCHKMDGSWSSPSSLHDTPNGSETSRRHSFSCNSHISITDSEYSDTVGLASTSSKQSNPIKLDVQKPDYFGLRSCLLRSACTLPGSFKDQNTNHESQKVASHEFNLKSSKLPRTKIKEPNKKKRRRN